MPTLLKRFFMLFFCAICLYLGSCQNSSPDKNASSKGDSLTKSKEPTILQQRQEFKKELFTTNAILNAKEQSAIKNLNYFLIDSSWVLNAKYISDTGVVFKMHTSTKEIRDFQRVGWLYFIHQKDSFRLAAYQSIHQNNAALKNLVFIPFVDKNSPEITYGAGRYLDIEIPPLTDSVKVDFNLAYNPYCAYSSRYSCPITPAENILNIAIKAGVQNPTKKEENYSASSSQGNL